MSLPRATAFVILSVAAIATALAQAADLRAQAGPGDVYVAQSGTRLRLLLDERALGGKEVEVGEMTFPPNVNSGEHQHGAVEIFYVVSGELEHVVNGKSTFLRPNSLAEPRLFGRYEVSSAGGGLKPGMAGFVRPPDKVAHKTGPGGPTKVVVIWAPAGEAARVAARWKKEP